MSRAFDEFPLSISDYISDTQHLTTIQHGAYLLLLMTMRRTGGWLDDDDVKLSRIVKMSLSRWKQIAPDIRSLMIFREGKISQKRLISDLEKFKSRSAHNAVSGRLGGIAKSLKNKIVDVANGSFLLDDRQNDTDSAHTLTLNSNSNTKKDSDSKKERKKERAKCNVGVALPSDWVPKESHYAKGAELGFDRNRIDFFAERMRNWAGANAHRPVARKSNWDLAFHNWISDKAERHGGAQTTLNGVKNETARGRSQPLTFASLAAELRYGAAGAASTEPSAGNEQVHRR